MNKKLKNTYIARNSHVYLLVDSGSTKTDWLSFDDLHQVYFETDGMNPSVQSSEYIRNQLNIAKSRIETSPNHIYYYGAGTASVSAKSLLKEALLHYFPDSQVFISSDLLAACRALCKHKEGICCILGTGSHAALSDGHQIIHQLPSLGYMLGDEGSGNQLGKEILKMYFYEKLELDLKRKMEEQYPEIKTDFIFQLYQSPKPSALLAKFAKFVIEQKSIPPIHAIIQKCFNEFIQQKLTIYTDKTNLPVHFCGSIAFYLQQEMKICLENAGFIMGNVIQKPMDQLLDYHRKKGE